MRMIFREVTMIQTEELHDAHLIALREPAALPGRGEQWITRLLEELGEDASRQGLERTPARVWKSLRTLTDGYQREVAEVVGEALFDESYDEMVTVRDIEFYS